MIDLGGPLNPEVVFREHQTQLGRLNDTFYRLPPFFASVIGGLWYFAASYLGKDRIVSAGVFLFSATCALTFGFTVRRHRTVIQAYIESIAQLAGDDHPRVPTPRIGAAIMLMILLGFAFVLSLMGCGYAIWSYSAN